jgi:2-polyprenyl-6-methoxyphenol hydroxylase-like FAD-dependent oxidoreductase
MVASYILAGELRCAGRDYATAFARYQQMFGPFVLGKQKAAARFAGAFAPLSHLGLLLRNQIMNLMRFQSVAKFAFGDLFDKIVLPEY